MVQPNPLPDDDRALIDGYLAGEPAAFGAVDRWVTTVVRGRYGNLSHLHDDLCQTVHASLVQELRAGRYAGEGELRAYVSAIAHRTALSALRRLYRDRAWSEPLEDEPAGEPANPYREVEGADAMRTVHAVLMALSASCRKLWEMVFADRLDYTTIAQRLGVPEGTVKSRMWHCRRKALEALRRVRLRASTPRHGPSARRP